jgi:hypothetical protein
MKRTPKIGLCGKYRSAGRPRGAAWAHASGCCGPRTSRGPALKSLALYFISLLACSFALPLWGFQITTRFIDGLGRPVADVHVELKYPKKGPDEKLKELEWLKATSDQEGKVTITYDETLIPTNETVWVSVKKTGYGTFTTDNLKSQYVLRRQFGAEDVLRIAQTSGETQKNDLRDLLVGELKTEGKPEKQSLEELVFFHERQFRPALRDLVGDGHAGKRACSLLAFIGMPEDIRFIVKNAPEPKRKLFEDRWAYDVACALFQPETPEEWDFLRRCAADDYYDRWVDAGAIRTLALIGSAQSKDVLNEAAKLNPQRKDSFSHALQSIQKGTFILEAADFQNIGLKLAQAIKIGEWQYNTEPRFNQQQDMALIDCHFIAGRELLVETATFHKLGDTWKLRGVRQTMQALLANPPETKRFVGIWQGFSDNQLEFARLELKQNGTGLLAVSFLPDSPPDKYIVTKWSVKDQLELSLKPAEPSAEPITIQNVKLGMDVLQFVLRPVHGADWTCRLKLFNEKTFQARSNAAKKALESLRKNQVGQ